MKYTKVILFVTLAICVCKTANCAVGLCAVASICDNEEVLDQSAVKIPSAAKIAKDLVGCKFREMYKYGYFKNFEWEIMPDEKVDVSILKIKKEGNIFHYDIKVELTLPSRACYILSCKVGYVLHKQQWVQDYFICERIMPKITHRYDNFISTQLVGVLGERSLVISNYSNVKLIVLGAVVYEIINQRDLFAVVVPPNGEVSIGGLFFGSIAEYDIHYVERN